MKYLLLLLSCLAVNGQGIINPFVHGTNAPASTLGTNLIAYWKLDEVSGNRADSGANGLTLTDVNTVGSTTGKISLAGQFVWSGNDYLSHTDDPLLSTGNIDYSFGVWVYLDSKGVNHDILGKWGGAGTREFLLFFSASADRFVYLISNDGTATGVTVTANNLGSPSLSTWYYIVIIHDSVNNTASIQVNNGAANSSAYTLGSIDGTAEFGIGSRVPHSGVYWDGRIDECAFWKKALSAGEVTELYNLNAGKTCCPF
jgi:hypothetical protein